MGNSAGRRQRDSWDGEFENYTSDRASPLVGTLAGHLGVSQMLSFSIGLNEHPSTSAGNWGSHIKQTITDNPSILPLQRRKGKIMLAPRTLLKIRPGAYTPQFLSVGPLHAHFTLSSSMDHCKSLCTKEFLDRCKARRGTFSPAVNLESLTDLIEHPSTHYFGNHSCDMQTLKLLITLDSVFVLEFLRCMFPEHPPANDRNSSTAYIWEPFNSITIWLMKIDLFIAGNQVRLSNLVKLVEYENHLENNLVIFLESAISKWSPFKFENNDHPNNNFRELLPKCEHLLDCLYEACVMNGENHDNSTLSENDHTKEEHRPIGRIPRASELHKIGVKFNGVNGNTSVIGYDRKTLIVKLPKLAVYEETEIVLRNLVAYEINSKQGKDICEYVTLMNSFIGNIDDLYILYKASVLENYLGSDEKMLLMWNDTCINIIAPKTERLDKMTQDIITHYKMTWRERYVEFRRRYFSRPWYTLSTIAAMLLLLMTAFQTIYTVVGFYKF